MEEIENSKQSMDKITNLITQNNELNNKYIPTVINQLKDIVQTMDQLELKKSQNLEDANKKNEIISDLKKNLSEINLEILKLEELIKELNKESNELIERRENEAINLENSSEVIESHQESYNEIKNKLEEKQTIEDLSKYQEEYFESLKSIRKQREKKVNEKNQIVELFERRVKSFKELLRKKFYVNSPKYLLLKNLPLNKEVSLSSLCKELGIDEGLANQFFTQLNKTNAPINFNEKNKTVVLKEEIDF